MQGINNLLMKIFGNTLLMLLLLTACGNRNDSAVTVNFIEEIDDVNESITISVKIGETVYEVSKESGMGYPAIEKAEYSDFDIPQDALDAIQNYWEGLLTVYYAKELGESISIRKAEFWQGNSGGFNYTEILMLPKNAIVQDSGNNPENDIVEGDYELVEFFEEGESRIPIFAMNGDRIEAWSMKDDIWWDNDFASEKSVGKTFRIRFIRSTQFLESCEEIQGTAKEEPQTVKERILEIKSLYKEIQGYKGEKSCRKATKTTYDGLGEGDGFPFENEAKECKTETGFLVKEVTLNGYEWSEHTSFFYKDDILFFVFSQGGAEACAYEYRVYYSGGNDVIRVLSAENDCDGDDVRSSEDVTEGNKRSEVLNSVGYALEQFTSILSQ